MNQSGRLVYQMDGWNWRSWLEPGINTWTRDLPRHLGSPLNFLSLETADLGLFFLEHISDLPGAGELLGLKFPALCTPSWLYIFLSVLCLPVALYPLCELPGAGTVLPVPFVYFVATWLMGRMHPSHCCLHSGPASRLDGVCCCKSHQGAQTWYSSSAVAPLKFFTIL